MASMTNTNISIKPLAVNLLWRYGPIIGCVWFCACTVGPDFHKPDNNSLDSWQQLPASHDTANSASESLENNADQSWWRQFNDSLLNSLIDKAIKENLTLQTATTLLAQSRAQRGIAAADQFPVINGNASYSRVQSSQEGILNLTKTLLGGNSTATSANGTGLSSNAGGAGLGAVGLPSARIAPFNLYQFGFDAAWELDLWGRVQREQESAQAGVEVAREQHHAAQLSVIAEVARNYFELRRLQHNLDLVKQQETLAQEQFDLTGFKTNNGLATHIDLENANLLLTNIQSQIPLLNQQIEQAGNQLTLLLGEQPGALSKQIIPSAPMPVIPQQVRLGLPNQLAERRPDIREAEANLHRTLANIGMATADFYPRFTLSGSTGLQALKLKDLGSWSALQYAMGPSIMLPIFQGGRLVSTLELREEEHKQAAINYQNTVLSAWHEIDNNLSAYQESQHRQQVLDLSVQSNTQIVEMDEQRFKSGISDYLSVLQARIALLRSEQNQIDGENSIAGNLIALYKALGGGWQVTQDQQLEERQVDKDIK